MSREPRRCAICDRHFPNMRELGEHEELDHTHAEWFGPFPSQPTEERTADD